MSSRTAAPIIIIAVAVGGFITSISNVISALVSPGHVLLVVVSAMGAAGVASSLNRIYKDALHLQFALTYTSTGAIALASAMIICASVTAFIPFGAAPYSLVSILIMLLLWIACAVAFFFAGGVVGFFLMKIPDSAGWATAAYSASVGAGTLIFAAFLPMMGGPGSLMAAGALAACGGIVAAAGDRDLKLRLIVASSLCTVACLSLAVHLFTPILSPKTIKGRAIDLQSWEAGSHLVTLVAENEKAEFGYSINGNSPLDILPTMADRNEVQKLGQLPFLVLPPPDTLVLGADSAAFIRILVQEGKSIAWLDHYGLSARIPGSAAGKLPAPPKARAIPLGIRNYLYSGKEKFDLAFWPVLRPEALVCAGTFTLDAGQAPTVQIMQVIFDRIKSGGAFAAVVPLEPEGLLLKLTVMSKLALEEEGKKGSESHMFIAAGKNNALLFVRKKAFVVSENSSLKDWCEKNDIRIMYSPNYRPKHLTLAAKAAGAISAEDFLNKNSEIRPLPSETKPGAFVLMKFDNDKTESLNSHHPTVLLALLPGMSILILVYLVPLFVVRSHRMAIDEQARMAGYYAVLCFGTAISLAPTVQMLHYWHPYSGFASIWALPTLLAGAAAGIAIAQLMKKLSGTRLPRLMAVGLIFTLLIVNVLSPAALVRDSGFFGSTLVVMMLFTVGIFIGLAIWVPLRNDCRPQRNSAPWYFGVTLASALFGLLAGPVLLASMGFMAMLWIGAILIFSSIWIYGET